MAVRWRDIPSPFVLCTPFLGPSGSAAELWSLSCAGAQQCWWQTDPQSQRFYSASSGSESTSAHVTSARGGMLSRSCGNWKRPLHFSHSPLGLSLTLLGRWAEVTGPPSPCGVATAVLSPRLAGVSAPERSGALPVQGVPSARHRAECQLCSPGPLGHRRHPCSQTLSGKEAPPSSTP